MMRKPYTLVVTIIRFHLLILVGLATATLPSSAQGFMDDSINAQAFSNGLNRVRLMMTELHRVSNVPGISIAVTYKERLMLAEGIGFSDKDAGETVRADTLFRFSDASSLFTATAIMQLVESGKINLDDDIRTYVKLFPRKKHSVTIRQLLSHTGGISHFTYADLDRGISHTKSIDDSLKRFIQRPLVNVPGSTYHYSSYGYSLLGAAIEQASGMTYMDYLKKHIFPDATITGVIGENMDNPPPALATFYNREYDTTTTTAKRDLSYVLAGGGLNGTPTDLAYLSSSLWAGRTISPIIYSQMLTPTKLSNGLDAGEADFKMGLGWKLRTHANGKLMAYHGGLTVGTSSGTMSIPIIGLNIAYLTNARWKSHPRETLATLAHGLGMAIEGKELTSECPEGNYKYTGKYNRENTKGTASFSNGEDGCKAMITMPMGYDLWGEEQFAPHHKKLPMIMLAGDDEKTYYGLVTPLGIFTVTATQVGDKIKNEVYFDKDRKWSFTLKR